MRSTVALAHDYLTQRGGAERVALALTGAFPGAVLHTSVYAPDQTFPGFRDVDVRTGHLDRVPVFRRDPRLALPLLPGAFDRIDADHADVVVVSSTGFAHGIQTRRPKVVYCHNPPRWLYQPEEYLLDQPMAVRVGLAAVRSRLLRWDQRAARRAQRYLVNSTVVRDRVRAAYGIDADVVPPPIGIDPEGPQEAVPGLEPGFHLTVGRPRGYKNVEVVCEAFRELPEERLVVVGGLPDGDWPASITGLVGLSDEQLRWLYAHCRATVAVAFEDFGLTPLEGNAFGKPALCLRAGGFLDTLAEGSSGWFVDEPTPAAVRAAVVRLARETPDEQTVLEHAQRYSMETFHRAVRAAAAEALAAQ